MSLLESVVRLMDIAKNLRSIAGELDQVDFKSQLVDELIRLEEIREEIFEAGSDGSSTASAGNVAASDSSSQFKLPEGGDNQKFAVLEPSAGGESYGLSIGGADEDEPDTKAESEKEPETETKPREESKEKSAGKKTKKKASSKESKGDRAGETVETEGGKNEQPSDGLSEADRFQLAEEALRDLEPIHQEALNKLNNVLSDEQKKKKSAVTKKLMQAGKKGKDLQQSVMAALNMSDGQQAEMAAAQKELKQVRTAMTKHVENLLSPEQTSQLLKNLSKDSK